MVFDALCVFVISFALSFCLTPLMRIISFRVGALDLPKKEKIHASPTPLLGGVAIALSFFGSVFLIHWLIEPLDKCVSSIILGSTVIWMIGACDDIKGIYAKTRLLIQVFVLTAIIISGGIRIHGIENFSLNFILMLFFVLGITNGFNFIDGMDGLAAGIAIISSIFFGLLAWSMGNALLLFILIALAGSVLGFLRFNFKPATIFMGDSGSTFLGFTLAGLTIVGQWSTKEINNLFIPPVILGIIIFDMILITVLRIKNGEVSNFREWIEYIGRDHFYDRLLNLGLSQRGTLLIAYLICGGLGLISLLIQNANLILLIGIILFLIAGGTLAIIKLDSVESREVSRWT